MHMGFKPPSIKNLETFQELKKKCLLKNVISSGFIHAVGPVRPLEEKKKRKSIKIVWPWLKQAVTETACGQKACFIPAYDAIIQNLKCMIQ